MCHRMAVRAERNEIAGRVNYISRDELRNRRDVVDMNEALTDITVCLFKVKTAGHAAVAEDSQAVHPIRIASLIAVYKYPHTSAFWKPFRIDFGLPAIFLKRGQRKYQACKALRPEAKKTLILCLILCVDGER